MTLATVLQDLRGNQSAPHKLLTTPQAAEYLELSEETLEKRRVYGQPPKFVRLGRSVRYRMSDLDQWAAECLRTSTSDDGSHAGKQGQ